MHKYFAVLLLLTIGWFTSISPVNAQSCAEIQSINSSINSLDVSQNTEFTCSVTVAESFAGSRWIACGVSINGSWPMDLCPSAQGEFGGWQGSRATFNCAIPAGTMVSSDKVELVGFDFSSSCGLDGAQRKELNLSSNAPGPQQPQPTVGPGTPQPTQRQGSPQTPVVRPSIPGNVCSIFRAGLQTCNSDVECMINIIKAFLGKTSASPTNAPSNPSPQSPNAVVYANWLALYNEVSQKTGVPPGFLRAIKEVETHSAFVDLSNFNQYTVPGTALPRTKADCQVNICGAAGPMQVTTESDMNGNASCPQCGGKCPNTWNSLTTEISQYNGNANPNYCNIRDNVYGAAVLLNRCNKIANGNKNVWDTDTSLIETMRCYAGNSLRNPQCGGPIPNVGGLTYCQWIICNVKGTC